MEKANSARDAAAKAVRMAWSQVRPPIKTEATVAGTPFDLDHLSISSRDRAAIPAVVYEKFGPRGDNIAKEGIGPDRLWLHIGPLWPADRPRLGALRKAMSAWSVTTPDS